MLTPPARILDAVGQFGPVYWNTAERGKFPEPRHLTKYTIPAQKCRNSLFPVLYVAPSRPNALGATSEKIVLTIGLKG